MNRRITRALLVALVALSPAALPATSAHADSWSSMFIESQLTNTCVAVPDSADGAAVTQEICNDVNLMLWNVTEVAPGAYRITNLASGKCLTAVLVTGSPVQQVTCNGSGTQQWLGRGSGNTFRFENVASGRCLARPGKDPGTALTHGSCSVPFAQWQLLY